jgi:hypothetical protein
MNYSRGKPRGIQQPKEKAYAASREESDPTRLNRLGQMRRGDVVTAREISDRARNLYAMECPRGELQLLHCRPHERLPRCIQLTKHAHVGGRHIRVAHDVEIV